MLRYVIHLRNTLTRQCTVVILVLVDMILLAFAALLAMLLTVDVENLSSLPPLITPHLFALLAILPGYVAIFYLFNLYRRAWHFASVEIFFGVLFANTVALFWLVAGVYLIERDLMPRDMLGLFYVLSIGLTGGFRLFLRIYFSRKLQQVNTTVVKEPSEQKRVVILGGGAQGVRLLMVLNQERAHDYQVIGFLDDHPGLSGLFVRGVRVLGPYSHLFTLLSEQAIDEVLIAVSADEVRQLRDHVMACRAQKVPVKIIPDLQDVLKGTVRMSLAEVSVEDLLRRPPIKTDLSVVGASITGKRVMVTGAGGSIGSELCRQILAFHPSQLILFGHGENSIDLISRELREKFPEMKDIIVQAIGSVADEMRVRQTFTQYLPQVVYHAAAHKHVPIMEANIAEAVNNNIFGTLYVAKTCGHFGIERMVLISTDKAVYPSSIMGATKWLCEEVLRALLLDHRQTSYITVRFGNVLGSRGSVVPIFKEQIRNGGPVTITDPEMTRYFMTIPEAVQLVLQAGSQGNSGDLFLLEMGKPIKILDLARDMIRLSGLTPDVDIPITYTGLRPGEKLHESLATDDSNIIPSCCKGLSLVVRRNQMPADDIRRLLLRLESLVVGGEPQQLLTYIKSIVPTLEVKVLPGKDEATEDMALV